jgi:hypothetical protein
VILRKSQEKKPWSYGKEGEKAEVVRKEGEQAEAVRKRKETRQRPINHRIQIHDSFKQKSVSKNSSEEEQAALRIQIRPSF